MAKTVKCSEIVNTFLEDPTLVDKISELSHALGVLHVDYKQLQNEYNRVSISGFDFYHGILSKWIRKNPKPTTVKDLLTILCNCELNKLKGTAI